MRIRTLLFSAALAVTALGQQPAAQAPPPTITIVLVRHAEAMPNSGSDPVLTDAGIERAKALAVALEHAGVKLVITTQYQRTILTGEPAATATKAQLVKAAVEGPLDAYVRKTVADLLAKHPGGTVLIVGHSNTVPALVKGFSGVDIGEIAHDSYDRMFVVTTNQAGKGHVVQARYGK